MRIRLLLLTAFATALPTVAQTTVTLAPDRDTSIYNTGGCNDLSNGAGTRLIAGNSLSGTRRALMHFDIAGSLPAGATILQVELDLTMLQVSIANPGNAHNFTLSRLEADWGEAGSFAGGGQGGGGIAQPGDTDWCDNFHPASQWTNPGGDFTADESAAARVGIVTFQRYTFPSSMALIDDVQAWLDGTLPNYGWILRGQEGGTATARAFGSREDGANFPRLHVTYIQGFGFWGGCDAPVEPQLVVDASVGLGRAAVGNTFRLQIQPGSSAPIQSPTFILGTTALPGGSPLPPPFGCDLHVAPDVWVGPADAAQGLTLNLPLNPAMIGTRLFWQGLGLSPNTSLVMTNGHVSNFRP